MGFNANDKLTYNNLVTVNAASTKVLGIDPNRDEFYIRNSSAGGQVITVVLGGSQTAAVANTGIVLAAGAYIQDSTMLGHTCFTEEVYVISSAPAGQISVYARSRS